MVEEENVKLSREDSIVSDHGALFLLGESMSEMVNFTPQNFLHRKLYITEERKIFGSLALAHSFVTVPYMYIDHETAKTGGRLPIKCLAQAPKK